MSIPNTYLSLHMIDEVAAFAGSSLGTPAILTFTGAHGVLQLSVFFRFPNTERINALVDAINAAAVALSTPPDADHTAAHDAAATLYKGAVT